MEQKITFIKFTCCYLDGTKLYYSFRFKVKNIFIIRKPTIPLCKLKNHKDCVNAIAWAPQSSYHICSVGDDSKAYIWDLSG